VTQGRRRLSSGRQAAYEIRVASSAAQLDQPDLWDSGKVFSSDDGNLAYAGAALTSRTVALLVTHASNRETASFSSSSPLLNSIYDITKRALENNMESVLTDCPDREKGPYTGDNLNNIDTELALFDLQAYEGQMVNNMRTSQRPTPLSSDQPGLIANIAPEFHIVAPRLFGMDFLDEPNWGGAVIMIPWNRYQVADGGNIPGLGDWSAAQSTTAHAVIDYGYYRGVSTVAEIAGVLGRTADVDSYTQQAESLADEYTAEYLHTEGAGHAWYANNTEASNAVALDAGLVPAQYHDAVVDSLVATGGASVQYVGYQSGAQVYDVGAGAITFVPGASTTGTVGGSAGRCRRRCR
jgi:alpha-L-rhamnosidase